MLIDFHKRDEDSRKTTKGLPLVKTDPSGKFMIGA